MKAADAAATVAVAALLALCAGLYLGGHPQDLPQPLRDLFVSRGVSLTTAARDAIEDRYFRKVPPSRLEDSAVRAMVHSLRKRFKDRFSSYFDPQQLRDFTEETNGRFSGVGMTVGEVKEGLQVVRVFAGSPAAKAGIAPGDLIVSVNGHSIAGRSSTYSSRRIKGRAGTSVTLGVERHRGARVRQVRLRRQQIVVPVATGRIVRSGGRRLGYVQFTSFTEGAAHLLRRAVRKVDRKGAAGLVIDLRGNGGGLLPQAVRTSSLFLPKGDVVVKTRSRTEGNRVYRTIGGTVPGRPVVVLIDRNTASAAEIFAAALSDDAKVPVVGTRSFGKGVFQQVLALPNGGALKLTTGEFFTPAGISLHPGGIKPDVFAKDRPDTRRDEALQRALTVLDGRLGS